MKKTIFLQGTKRSYVKPHVQVFNMNTRQILCASYRESLTDTPTNDIEFD